MRNLIVPLVLLCVTAAPTIAWASSPVPVTKAVAIYTLNTYTVDAQEGLDELYETVALPKADVDRIDAQLRNAENYLKTHGLPQSDWRIAAARVSLVNTKVALQRAHDESQHAHNLVSGLNRDLGVTAGVPAP